MCGIKKAFGTLELVQIAHICSLSSSYVVADAAVDVGEVCRYTTWLNELGLIPGEKSSRRPTQYSRLSPRRQTYRD